MSAGKTKAEICESLGITRNSLNNYIRRCGIESVGRCRVKSEGKYRTHVASLYDIGEVMESIKAREAATYQAHCGCAEKMREAMRLVRVIKDDTFEDKVAKYRERGFTAGKIAKTLNTTIAKVWPIIERTA